MSSKGWIACDLDGTLAFYDEWRGISHIGHPIPAMLARVKEWVAAGKQVKIFTARVAEESQRDVIIQIIHDWLEANSLPRLEVTNVKDFAMVELWDDRAVQVEMNTGNPVGYSTRGHA